jgi:hypothetical protein
MNWDAIGALAELAGAFGVIVSLLYLGVQIRIQNRESRLNSVSESIRHFNDVLSGIAHDPDLCSIYVRGLSDFESLDPEERARFSAHVGRFFRVIEGLYEYHLEGRITLHSWEAMERTLKDIAGTPGTHAWWQSRAHWYGTPFQTYIFDILRSGPVTTNLYGNEEK